MFDMFFAMNIIKGWRKFEDVPKVAQDGVKKQLQLLGYNYLAQ